MRCSVLVPAALVIVSSLAAGGCVPEVPESPKPQVTAVRLPAPGARTLTPPEWSIGDRWEYSDGHGLRVTEVGAEGVATFRLSDGRDQWMRRRAFFVDVSFMDNVTRAVVYRTASPMQLFSVPEGTPVVFMSETMRNGELLRHNVSWIVEGREMVTVPAGTFDCWIVTGRVSNIHSHYQGYERWWYSPEVRNYVRLEYKSGDRPELSRVLVSYQLNQPAGGKDGPNETSPRG
ncbi:MAG: hypothetical protein ABT940_02910 [Alphaproteobacteria bacterium]